MRMWSAVLCFAGCLAGCQRPAPSSPDATFAAFDQALRKADYNAAADCIDFNQLGRQGNPDWDTFPPSQQHLIASKMREATIQELGSWGYPTAGMSAAPAQVNGTNAAVTAEGGGKTLKLTLQQVDGIWQITGGVPGMTSSSGMSDG